MIDSYVAMRQYWPVWLDCRTMGSPGWMGLVLLVLGWLMVYCSGAVAPVPLLHLTKDVRLSALQYVLLVPPGLEMV